MNLSIMLMMNIKYMPPEWRHRIALYADNMAAGANTLEELFEIYKALVKTLAKAGIQIKSSKVEFGVEEITFHNYRVIGGTGLWRIQPPLRMKILIQSRVVEFHKQ